MKKIVAFLFALVCFVAVNAQSTSPRFGTAKNQDNTGRVLTYAYTTWTDAAGADSVAVTPNAYQSYYRVALTDSFMVKSPSVSRSYAGDKITVVASGASGTKLKFAGTNWVMSATVPYATTTLVLSSGGKAIVTFVFDGAKWVEAGKVVL